MYSIILVALDGSQTASHALDAALELAADAHARLVPVYVVDMPVFAFDTPGYDPSILVDAFREEGRRVLDDAQARMTRRGVAGAPRLVEVEPPGEDVAERLERAAREIGASLIVMGTHGRRGVRRLMLGSVAERLLRHARCPVLMIPARGAPAADANATHPTENA